MDPVPAIGVLLGEGAVCRVTVCLLKSAFTVGLSAATVTLFERSENPPSLIRTTWLPLGMELNTAGVSPLYTLSIKTSAPEGDDMTVMLPYANVGTGVGSPTSWSMFTAE